MPKPDLRTTYKYSEDFKATAVKLSNLPGVAIQDVAQSLYIHPFMLSRWRKKVREGVIVAKGTDVELIFEEHTKILKERSKLEKAINRLVPDYRRMQIFTDQVLKLESKPPSQIKWDIAELKKQLGKLSEILHWNRARNLTTESREWIELAFASVEKVLNNISSQMKQGVSMAIDPKRMRPEIFEIWDDYKNDRIDLNSTAIRLN